MADPNRFFFLRSLARITAFAGAGALTSVGLLLGWAAHVA